MKYLVAIWISIASALVLSCEKSTDPSGSPMISISVNDETIVSGSVFELSIEIIDFPMDLFAISGRLSFDENRLAFDVNESNWIGEVWSQSAIGLFEIENGIVYFSITQIAGSDEIIGEGTILTLQVTPEQAGSASIDLLPSQLVFYDSEGDELNIENLEIDGITLAIQ